MRTLCRLGGALAAAFTLGACGSVVHGVRMPGGALRRPALGTPGALATLRSEADRLIPGSPRAFATVLRRLRGYPVVVNEWASWCPGCVFEFPAFQRAALTYGARIAFLGIDVADSSSDAKAFLAKLPVPYPIYTDPETSIAQFLNASGYYPQTLFFDRLGRRVFDHPGSYKNVLALERDIDRYALSELD